MFTFYKKSQKGQDLVEYAMMLAIIIGIGWGIYSQTGVADSIKNVFGNASSLMETAKKNTGMFDMEAVLKRLNEMEKGYDHGSLTNGPNYKRGFFSSSWLTEKDAADDLVKSLASELGATMWTYYNGRNPNNKFGPGGVGLYWTTEEDFDSVTLPKDEKGWWSKENVLSYRYDPNWHDPETGKTGGYSVIENRAWPNQYGSDGKYTHNGLAQQPFEQGKPAGTTLGTYSTYEAAQQRYNEVKKAQGGYIYMGTAQTK